MKILFLCHRLPYPPKRGGKIRHLGRRHEVTVATIARSRQEAAEGQGLREHCHDLHVATLPDLVGWTRFALHGLGPYPSTFGYFYSARLQRAVDRLLATRGFDRILVHCSSMGPYVARHRGCRKVMDFGDADSEKWLEYARSARFPLSVAFRWEGFKVRRWERWLAARFDACSVTSPRERQVMAAYLDRPLTVIPNGVDLDYFRPRRGRRAPYDPERLVFTGNMSYPPNVDAVEHLVREILPRIRRQVPAVELYIVGMDPSPAVTRLADPPRVVVTGRVDDVRPYFEEAAVAVAPLRVARGLQNKVLEAMAMRVPVVASPAALGGINAAAERDVRVAADPDAFARVAAALLRDPQERERYAAAGRTCVEQNHHWERLLGRLEDLVTGEAGHRTAPVAQPVPASPRGGGIH